MSPDGQEPRGMRLEGQERPSNPQGVGIGGLTEPSPYESETSGRSG